MACSMDEPSRKMLSEEECLVRTSYGQVRGALREGCVSFRGVPYAAPPERFRRSLPPRPWEGVRDCSRNGRRALQPVPGSPKEALKGLARRAAGKQGQLWEVDTKTMSEDCLFLNITTPSTRGHLPVICWIHGGAFIFGSGSDAMFRGAALGLSQQVVVVSINYRLGAWGFLTVPGGDSNCGTWDQLQALRWIHSEIERFGGDPTRVTICGQSAGGMSCGVLLTSPLAQPFFQRCILMSGALSNVMESEDAASVGREFCRRAGVAADAAVLRGLSVEQLLELQTSMKGVMPFQPCVDGELIPELPLEAVAHGSIDLRHKEVILGCTAQEYNLFSLPSVFHIRKPLAEVAKKAAAHLGPLRMAVAEDGAQQERLEQELRGLLKRMRSERRHANWGDAEKDLYSMLIFLVPQRLAAEALSRVAGKVFMYSIDFDAGRLGAAHAFELPLLFGTHKDHWVLRELSGARRDPGSAQELSRRLMASVGSFVRTGSPAPAVATELGMAQHWPQYLSEGVRSVFVFDKECKVLRESEESLLSRAVALLGSRRRPFGLKRHDHPRSRL